jgi:hypothetical protein
MKQATESQNVTRARVQRIETTLWPRSKSVDQYHTKMEPPEIDPELNVRALEEAARRYPEFAGRALGVVARPLVRGFAWQVEWDGPPPSGEDAWEFQNAAIREYKRLAGIP